VAVAAVFFVPDAVDIVAVCIYKGLAVGVVRSLALVLVVFLLHCLSFPALGREAADTTNPAYLMTHRVSDAREKA